MARRRRPIAVFVLPLSLFAATTATVALMARVSTLLPILTATAAVDTAVETAVTLVGASVAAWLSSSLLLASACAAARTAGRSWRAGERTVHRWAPRVVRQALVSIVVAGIGLGTGGAAQAESLDPATVDLGWTSTATAPPAVPDAHPSALPTSGTAVPDAPGLDGPPSAPGSARAGRVTASLAGTSPQQVVEDQAQLAPSASGAPTGTHVVRPGETLWSIAALQLPVGARATEIARAWPSWYAVNRAVIGGDPNVIRPGQTLRAPTEATEEGRPS